MWLGCLRTAGAPATRGLRPAALPRLRSSPHAALPRPRTRPFLHVALAAALGAEQALHRLRVRSRWQEVGSCHAFWARLGGAEGVGEQGPEFGGVAGCGPPGAASGAPSAWGGAGVTGGRVGSQTTWGLAVLGAVLAPEQSLSCLLRGCPLQSPEGGRGRGGTPWGDLGLGGESWPWGDRGRGSCGPGGPWPAGIVARWGLWPGGPWPEGRIMALGGPWPGGRVMAWGGLWSGVLWPWGTVAEGRTVAWAGTVACRGIMVVGSRGRGRAHKALSGDGSPCPPGRGRRGAAALPVSLWLSRVHGPVGSCAAPGGGVLRPPRARPAPLRGEARSRLH